MHCEAALLKLILIEDVSFLYVDIFVEESGVESRLGDIVNIINFINARIERVVFTPTRTIYWV